MATVTNAVQIVLGAKGISATSKALDELSKATVGFGNAISAITGPVSKFGAILTGAVTAVAGTLGFVGFTAGIKDLLEFATEIDRAAEQTGASISKLVTFRSALKAAGVESTLLAQSVSRLQKSIGDAADAAGVGAQAKFERLGLNFEDLLALDPAAQFEAVATALSQVEDKSLRASRTVEIFGKKGEKLIPIFERVAESTSKGPSNFALIMERTAPTLHQIEIILAGLPSKARGFFAGFAEPFAPQVLEFLKQIKDLDLSKAGESVAAFLKLIIKAFEEDKLAKLIELSFKAGFDLSENAFDKFYAYIISELAKPATGDAFLKGILEGFKKAITSFDLLTGAAAVPFVASFMRGMDVIREMAQKLVEEVKVGFIQAANFLITGLQKATNEAIKLVNALTGQNIPLLNLKPIDYIGPQIQGAITMEQALLEAERQREESHERLKKNADAVFNTIEKLLHLEVNTTDATGQRVTAYEQLRDLIRQMLDDIKKGQGLIAAAAKPPATPREPKFNLEENQLALKKQLYDIDQKRARLDADFTKTNVEKQAERIALLTQERDLLLAQAAILDEQARKSEDTAAADKFRAAAEQAREQAGRADVGILQQGPPLTSVGDQLVATMTQARDQLGTIATQIGQVLTKTIGGAIEALSNGIEGLINGTLTWSQALQQVGRAILGSIIKAIAQMIAQMLVQSALSVITAIITGKAILKAFTPAAIAASIATEGASAAAGLAAFTGAITLGSSIPYATGGYTGAGPTNEPAGIVHRGEYVLPASAVRAIGLPSIEAFRADAAAYGTTSADAAAPAINNEVNVYAFNSYDDAMKRWFESSEGRAVFVDMTRKTQHLVSR